MNTVKGCEFLNEKSEWALAVKISSESIFLNDMYDVISSHEWDDRYARMWNLMDLLGDMAGENRDDYLMKCGAIPSIIFDKEPA